MSVNHTFTKSEIRYAKHLLHNAIIKRYGEVWRIKSDGEYRGADWRCASPLLFDHGIWLLCERIRHKGATRATGLVEVLNGGEILRFILLYDPESKSNIMAS